MRRLERKRSFWGQVGAYVAAIVVTNVVWFALGGQGYYWPLWVIVGCVLGLIYSAISTFGPASRPVTEQDIQREARRISGEDLGRR
ncbi:2TM domain-containing protein [Leucobacter sp. CSA2]|uniref:2TM domain-containing protein n=1 Tax=Leucobacter edaphi TaxID=2796472 RepID=A0A934UX69_9MICO|nr:2TM domain-containing protein [Leucobacter edaphi]MBK0420632.1 2TM domain-containing protein [Leucobacter edaphi]